MVHLGCCIWDAAYGIRRLDISCCITMVLTHGQFLVMPLSLVVYWLTAGEELLADIKQSPPMQKSFSITPCPADAKICTDLTGVQMRLAVRALQNDGSYQ